MKIKVGITGQSGFVGTHLYNYLGLKEDIELIPFQKDFFEKTDLLLKFVLKCDIIVHLAGINRHESQTFVYEKNLELTRILINTCEIAQVKPHIIFSSSSQEDKDNPYGNAKKESRLNLELWASKVGAKVTGLVIPNVFGPFGKPNYNSVIATFCHKITRGENPQILQDSELSLVYINELIEDIYQEIILPNYGKIIIMARHKILVSALLNKLNQYRELYMVLGEFPDLDEPFDLALFNTFRCYVPYEHYPVKFKQNIDNRGMFIELTRTNSKGQSSYSTTNPNITRGNHFHTRKAERFAVIQGKAKISIRKINTDEVIDYYLDGKTPSFVDMPIWHTHNITNIGEGELLTMFWINEPYDSTNPDTYFINV